MGQLGRFAARGHAGFVMHPARLVARTGMLMDNLIMIKRPRSRWFPGLLLVCLVASFAVRVHGQTADAAPKKQLPADQRAFKAARAVIDPEQRLAAMRAFVHDYPKSERVGRAQTAILVTLTDHFPQREADIDAQAKVIVKRAGKGEFSTDQDVYVVFLLAETGAHGVDLPYAEKIAKDAVAKLNEATYDKETAAEYAKYKVPLPKPEALHKQFANSRAEALAMLADVYLREGDAGKAAPLIDEAYKLDPLVDDVNSQRGRLAELNHDDALTLDSFERAQLLGALKPADHQKMMELYRQAHGGSDAGFTAEMDARYAQIFPPPFAPGKPTIAGGHAVLLELFTGSACGPCVGGDLAVDGLLKAYPRSEIVALAFDQHIPEPDPLANPDSVARGEFYDLTGTPTFVLDGKVEPIYGGDRDGSQELYEKLAKLVDTEAATSTGVQLKLSADASGGVIHAEAVVTLPSEADVEKAIQALAPPPDKKDERAKDAKAATTTTAATPAAATPAAAAVLDAAAAPKLIVNFALVEDDVRYSGENGIRFHRMVVRALAKPADSGLPVDPGGAVTLGASFEPAAISKSLTTYLDGYEQQNDRFGKIKFLTKDMTMEPSHLFIAAWVQDSVTHRVLQSAIVPVGEHQKEAQ
jgi:thiol-disulfide isomerase/thioredoxin